MAKSAKKRKCEQCHRKKARHLWLAKEWKKKGPGLCKSCYKQSDAYRTGLEKYYTDAYGITLDDYKSLLESQNGCCAICRKKPGRRRLAVDHDHERVGKRESVRGLLCRPCNEYLGHIADNPETGTLIYEYLSQGTLYEKGLL